MWVAGEGEKLRDVLAQGQGLCVKVASGHVRRNRAARISQLIDCGLKGRLEGGGIIRHGSRALVKGVRFFGHQCGLNILGPGAPADCARGFLGESLLLTVIFRSRSKAPPDWTE